MILQLKCLGVVLAGPVLLAERGVDRPQYPVANGKIRIKLDGALKKGKGLLRSPFSESLHSQAVHVQGLQ